MRLIDADALHDFVSEEFKDDVPYEWAWALTAVDHAPAVDAVPVLRCRDCKYWGDEDGKLQGSDGALFARCKAHNYLIDGRHTGWCPTENDFCSYGERKC